MEIFQFVYSILNILLKNFLCEMKVNIIVLNEIFVQNKLHHHRKCSSGFKKKKSDFVLIFSVLKKKRVLREYYRIIL
jgi:hypothetical protein